MPKRPGHFTVILAALLVFGFGDAHAQMGFGGFGGFGGGGFGGGGFGGFGGGRGFGRQGGGGGFGGGGMGNNRGNGSGMSRGNGSGFGRMGQGQNGGGYGRMGQGQAGGGRGSMGQTGRATGGNQTGRYGAGNGRPAGTANNSGRPGPYGQQPTRTMGNYGQQNRPSPNKTRPPYGPVVGQGPGYHPPRQTYYPPRVARIPVVPVPVYTPPVVAGPPSPPSPPRPIVSGGGGGGPPARAAAPARPPVNSVPAADNQYVSNEVLIRTNPQTPIDEINRIERQYGLTPLGTTRVTLLDADLRRYRVANGASVPAALQALGGEAGVAAQPNYLFELQDSVKFDYSKPAGQTPRAGPDTTTPAPQPDPQTIATTSPSAPGSQPNPANTVAVEPEHPPQYAIDAMRLVNAHKMATGADVLIAIIDTGLDESHPEIEGTVADRFDAVDGTFTPHSHGTGMAGVIVAHKSLVGIAPGARLLAIRAFASMAKGARGTSYDILRGLDFAADHHARIINMSFAGPRDALLAEALAAARAKGMIAVAAAGNAGPASQPLYPAAEPGVIAITATDTQNRLYARANRGDYVTAAAPGVDVIAPSPGGAVQLSSGTSIAAAEASGVIALLLQANPQMSAEQVQKVLGETAARSPADAGNSVIDASAALQSMMQAQAHQSQ